MAKQSELSKDITRIRKNAQTLWDKIVALSYLHPELSEDSDYLDATGSMIYLSDTLTRLAKKREGTGGR